MRAKENKRETSYKGLISWISLSGTTTLYCVHTVLPCDIIVLLFAMLLVSSLLPSSNCLVAIQNVDFSTRVVVVYKREGDSQLVSPPKGRETLVSYMVLGKQQNYVRMLFGNVFSVGLQHIRTRFAIVCFST